MKIQIISVGKLSAAIEEIASRYIKMNAWQIKNTLLKASKKSSIADIKHDEASYIRSKVGLGSYVIVLDQAGGQVTSEKFSSIFANQMMSGKNIDFIIGGAYGLDESILKSSNRLLSLSEMTLPHQFVKVLLLEQIYRAQTIIDNHPYHK